MKTNSPTHFLSFFYKASFLIIFIWVFPANTQSHAPFLMEDGKNVIAANLPLANPLGLRPCEAPAISQISVSKVTETSATLNCSITSVKNYSWEYRVGGSSTWINAGVTKPGKIVLKGLFPGTDYEYRVRVNCSDLFTWSDWSPAGNFTTQGQCKLPESIQIYASNITMASARLHISPRSISSGPKITAYDWQVRMVGEASWRDLEATTKQFTEIFGLQRGTTYEFRVRIQCSINNWSDWSAPEIFTTVCRVPLQYSATDITNSSARLYCDMEGMISYGWQYRISGNSSWINTNNTTTNYVDILGLASGTAYQFRVRVQCASVWSDWSVPKTFLTSCNPATANHLSVSNITESSARLNCSVTGVDTYYWQYRLLGADAWIAAGATVTNYNDLNGLEAGTAYEFRVAMHCGTRGSGWSPSISFVTGCFKPNNFSQLFVTDVSYSSAILNCSLNGVDAYGWQYRLDGASDWLDLGTTPGNNIKVTGLSPGTTYQYRARVRCGPVWGDWSFLRVFTTYHCGIAPYSSQINVQYITESSARLRCDVNGIRDGFGWQYRVLGTSSWTDPGTTTSSFIDVNGLRPGTTYEYRARVQCGTSWSPWSDIENFTTLGVCSPPDEFQLNASFGVNEVTLRCNETSVSKYGWQYREKGASQWLEVGPTTTPYVDVPVIPNAHFYEFRVKVQCGTAWSDWSGIKIEGGCDGPYIDQFSIIDYIPPTYYFSVNNSLWGFAILEFQYRKYGHENWEVKVKPAGEYFVEVSLDPGTTYEYRVVRSCSFEIEYISPIKIFETQCDPLIPPSMSQLFAVTSIGSETSVQLHCSAVGASQYYWQYRQAGSSSWIFAGATNFNDIWVNGLQPGTLYYFQAALLCGSTSTSWSSSQTFTTLCFPPLYIDQQLFATNITSSTATLNCDLLGKEAYDWQYMEFGSSTWLDLSSTTSNFINIANLEPNTLYHFRVKVKCSAIWSEYSNYARFRTEPACPAPDLSELFATNITYHSARLNCLSDLNPAQYHWQYRISPSDPWIDLGTTTLSYFDLNDLNFNSLYEFRVAILCGSAWSAYSEAQQFATAPTPAYMTPLSPSGINGQVMGLPASSKEIWLYPNPTSGAMHVENLESDGELMIFSLYGTLEQTFPVYSTSMEVDLSHLPNGVYFLKYRRGYKIITRRFYLIR